MLQRVRRSLVAFIRRWPPRNGPLTMLFVVFRPYVLPPLLLALALIPWRYARHLRFLLIAGMTLAWARRARPRRTAHQPRPDFGVVSWNMLFSNPRADAMVQFLATVPAPIVALQELTAAHVDQIAHDQALAQRYPHQILWAWAYGAGMALLSQYPIIEQGKLTVSPVLWARLDVGAKRSLLLVSAHPTFFPPRAAHDAPTPPRTLRQKLDLFDPRFLRYNATYRDDGIMRIRRLVDQLLERDMPLLLVGDFNVTERERAYRELAAGLTDVHLAAGMGDGRTWRPEWLAWSRFALLRIDYMWCNAALVPLRMSVDRTPRGSDHSLIYGEFALPPLPK